VGCACAGRPAQSAGEAVSERAAAHLLIVGGDVITMGPTRAVLMDAAIAVAAGRIAAIGSVASLRARFPGTQELDARGCLVIPGMVNAHQHATADPLVRSTIPDDIDATESIFGWIMPLHAADELFAGAAVLAERLGTGVTWHMSPSQSDVAAYERRSRSRPVLHLRDLGVLGPRLLLGHAVWLNDAEVDALLESDTAVASCPAAYLRLGQGYGRAGRHAELARRGGRLALGCDSHNAGDSPDVLRAAWLLAALERDRGGQWSMRADEVFALATIEGARANTSSGAHQATPCAMCWSTAPWWSGTARSLPLT
jgi:cytosine/adenosine deaminase-related metal-dependent hydrolase